VPRERAFRAAVVFRFRVAAAFLPAATRFVDFRAVDFLAVDFRAAVVFRFLVAAAFLPAATRFVDFRAVDLLAVDFRAVSFLAVDLLAVDFLAVDFRAAVVFRFLVAAAFLPAATRFVDFRTVDLLAVDFRAVDLLAVDFLAVDFLAIDLLAVDFLAVDLLALDVVRVADVPSPGVRLRPVDVRVADAGLVGEGAISAPIGPPSGIVAAFERGTGRSHAGVSGRQDGSGALGASSVSGSAGT
jgi:hypothetical protein